MDLPLTLKTEIVNFFLSLPNIHDSESQRAFIYSIWLDPELQGQIIFGKPPSEFVPLLISILFKYGKLKDGRDALQAVLQATKNYIGEDKRISCDILIHELELKISGFAIRNTWPKASRQNSTSNSACILRTP